MLYQYFSGTFSFTGTFKYFSGTFCYFHSNFLVLSCQFLTTFLILPSYFPGTFLELLGYYYTLQVHFFHFPGTIAVTPGDCPVLSTYFSCTVLLHYQYFHSRLPVLFWNISGTFAYICIGLQTFLYLFPYSFFMLLYTFIIYYYYIFNRPGVAGAVFLTASYLFVSLNIDH